MSIEIKDIDSNYAPDMEELYAECFKDRWSCDFFKTKLETSCFAYGAFLEDKLVGFILVQLIEGEGEILTFCVDQKHRNNGIGKLLLKKTLALSKINSCFLEVSSNNNSAISLYEQLNFEKKGLRTGYYHSSAPDPQDAIIYGYIKK